MNASRRQCKRRFRNLGFTLLEVLLTSLLASVVLAALWSLSDIYLRVFAAGQRKVEEVQLVRSITQFLGEDISQVIQLPDDQSYPGSGNRRNLSVTRPIPVAVSRVSENSVPEKSSPGPERMPFSIQASPAGERSNSGPVVAASNSRQSDRLSPRMGLFGTRRALRLIVLQTDPRTVRAPRDLTEILPQPGQIRPPLASELRTIEYSFSATQGASSNEQRQPSGLIRREWPWETWIGLRMEGQRNNDSTGFADMLPDAQADWTSRDVADILSEDNHYYHVSQIIGLEFHYYDGQNWESEWNSWERQKLPLLVEVMLQIRIARNTPGIEADEEEEDATEVSLSRTSNNGVESSSRQSNDEYPVYRRLVHLPFAEAGPTVDVRENNLPGEDTFRSSPPTATNRQLGANRP